MQRAIVGAFLAAAVAALAGASGCGGETLPEDGGDNGGASENGGSGAGDNATASGGGGAFGATASGGFGGTGGTGYSGSASASGGGVGGSVGGGYTSSGSTFIDDGGFGVPADGGLATTLELLAPNAKGAVQDSVTGIVGFWYAYGDGLGDNGMPPGSCETTGGFMPDQCSQVTSPQPGQPFPPANGAMCLTGTGAQVLTGASGQPDYADIWGIGIGLDLNNVNGTRAPYDAPDNHVVGFAFTITGVPAGGIRVEFPTTDTDAAGNDPYAFEVYADGSYTVYENQLEPAFAPPPGQPPYETSDVLSIQFHVATNAAAPIPVDGMCVSNLAAILSE